MEITGGCLCRNVRYRISAAPLAAESAGAGCVSTSPPGSGTVNVCFPSESVSVEGELADYRSTADSGSIMHRRFCPVCGTPVFSAAEQRPHLVFVRAGTLDDRECLRPAMTIWASQAPSWAAMNPALPQLTGQPPPVK